MRPLTLGHDLLLRSQDYSIPSPVRERHLYVLGKSGVGKSTLLHRLIFQDAKQPTATIIFDAGDLATDVFETLPDRLLDRINFFTVKRPIPYNPLLRRHRELAGPERETVIAGTQNELFGLLDQVVAEGSSTAPLSARMKRLLSHALREVMNKPDPTLSGVATYIRTQRDELGRALNLSGAELTGTTEAVVDRLSQFLGDPRIRRIICAPHALDFSDVIDSGQIFLISLQGLEPAFKRFVGTLLFSGLQATITEREKKARRPVAIYVDEFHDYIKSSFAVENFQLIFSQGRKYRTSLTVAHTDFAQIPNDLLHTIHSTVASAVSFSCGPTEAVAMARLFGKDPAGGDMYPAHVLSFLEDRTAVARVGNSVFRFTTYPPPSHKREIIEDTTPLPPTPPDPFHVDTPASSPRENYGRARTPRPRSEK